MTKEIANAESFVGAKNFKVLDKPGINHLEKMFATRKFFNDPAMSVKRMIKHYAKVDIPSSGKLIHLV